MSPAPVPPHPAGSNALTSAATPRDQLMRGIVLVWPLRWWLWIGTTAMVVVVNAAISAIDPFSANRYPIQAWLFSAETLVTVVVLAALVWAHTARRAATARHNQAMALAVEAARMPMPARAHVRADAATA